MTLLVALPTSIRIRGFIVGERRIATYAERTRVDANGTCVEAEEGNLAI